MIEDIRASLPRLPLVGEGKRGPEGYLTYLLRQASASVRLALDRALAKEHITHPQQSALTMIRAYEAISAADLARLTMLTPQTINGIVRALAMRGAIRKEPDRINRRILRLIITEEGRALNRRCRALTAPVEAALNAKMDAGAEGAIRQWLVEVARAGFRQSATTAIGATAADGATVKRRGPRSRGSPRRCRNTVAAR